MNDAILVLLKYFVGEIERSLKMEDLEKIKYILTSTVKAVNEMLKDFPTDPDVKA